MSKRWTQAAKRYRDHRELGEFAQKQAERNDKKQASAHARLREWLRNVNERKLEDFLKSEAGIAALKLLKESSRWIVFGEDRHGGFTEVYFLDGEGFGLSYEASGTWQVYSNDVPKPKITRGISAQEMIVAVTSMKNISDIIPWLEKKLDKIAADTPK